MRRPKIRVAGAVLSAPYARDLADFYAELMGWEKAVDEGDWVILPNPDGGTALSFQTEENYRRPVWPPGPEDQQVMAHLDVAVDDLEAGVAWAESLGAVRADHQPNEGVQVMLDPAGHPFCLFVGHAPDG